MGLIVPDQAEKNSIDNLVSKWATATIDLFQNNITPSSSTVIGDFTVASYSSYAQQTPTFSTAATDGTGRGYTLSSTITFPLAGSGTQTVYGWYLRDAAGGLIACKRFDAPVTVSTSAGVDGFSIKYTLRQEP